MKVWYFKFINVPGILTLILLKACENNIIGDVLYFIEDVNTKKDSVKGERFRLEVEPDYSARQSTPLIIGKY